MTFENDQKERGDDWMDVFDTFHSLFRRKKANEMKAKNLIGFMGGGGASNANLTLYPSTYRAFLAGEGTLDYLSFGGLSRMASGRLVAPYRQGSGHNTGPDGSIMATYSDDGFATKATVTITASNAVNNLADTDSFTTSTGRTIIFYTKSSGAGNQDCFYKYSDNADLSSLSAETRLTTDYDGKFLNGTGTCLEIGGALYKVCWGSNNVFPAAQPMETPVYKSVDNGDTWTRISYISSSVENYDETTLALHPSGRVYAFQRDNVTKKLIVKYSDDVLLTWSAALITDIPSQAKSPAVITPNGNFCIISRLAADPDLRTIIIKSSDGVNYTWDYLDEHLGAYMYGGVVWDGTKIQVVHAVSVDPLAETTLNTSGPTIMIYREIEESATPVTAPTQYDSAYRCLLDYVQANGENMPSDALKTIHSTMLSSFRSGGFLNSIYYFHWGNNKDASLGAMSLREWLRPWLKATAVNSPTYGLTGYQFNGTTQYIDMVGGRLDNGGAKYSQNNAGLAYYTPDNTQDAAFGRVCGNDRVTMILRASDGNLYYRCNDGTNTTLAVSATTGGHFFDKRHDSANKYIWRDGVQIGTAAVASATLVGVSNNPYIGCWNQGGTPSNFSNKTCGYAILSLGFSGQEAAYYTILSTAVNAINAL